MTLEEVFLKVGEGTADNNPDEELDEGDIDDDYTIVDECVTGLSLIFLQYYALLVVKVRKSI